MSKFMLLCGIANTVLAVALGAFGAHVLKHRVGEELISIFHTANAYHFYHAFGLIILGLLLIHYPGSNSLRWSGMLMLLGVILFSGSLYLLVITRLTWLGMIAPFGGLAFISAWLIAFIAVLKQ